MRGTVVTVSRDLSETPLVPALRGGVRVERHSARDRRLLLPATPLRSWAGPSAREDPRLRVGTGEAAAATGTRWRRRGSGGWKQSSGRGARLPRQSSGGGEQWGGRVSILGGRRLPPANEVPRLPRYRVS
jgi:hypothetical protein